MFIIGDNTPTPYTVDKFTFSESVASLVLESDDGQRLVVAEPRQGFNKTNGLVTIQARRPENSVTFNPRHWTGYNLKYKK